VIWLACTSNAPYAGTTPCSIKVRSLTAGRFIAACIGLTKNESGVPGG
jgi:hypothetical protein